MFYAAKGHLLQRKTAPFKNRLIISHLQSHILSVSDRREPARNMHTAGVFQLSGRRADDGFIYNRWKVFL